MKKQILTLIAFASSALASQPAVQMSVPFAFVAGKTTLPAGTYTVEETGSRCILIRGKGGSVFVLDKSAAMTVDQAGRVAVRFGHTASGYVLESMQAEVPAVPR